MHCSMRPIKIGIVEKNEEKQLQKTPNGAVRVEIPVEFHESELIQEGN